MEKLNIKTIAPKPSDALQAMIDGLREQSTRQNFRVDMHTFGEYSKNLGICYGCAATCAVQKLAGKNFEGSEIDFHPESARYLNLDKTQMVRFESAIDDARKCILEALFEFYEIQDVPDEVVYPESTWTLRNADWEMQLPRVQRYVDFIREQGYEKPNPPSSGFWQ
jgi:hypothetical protein